MAKDFLTAGMISLCYHYCQRGRLGLQFLGVFLLILALSVFFGTKSLVYVAFAVLAYYYHYLVRPISNKRILVILALLIAIVSGWVEICSLLFGQNYSLDLMSADWWKENALIFSLYSGDDILKDVWDIDPQWGYSYFAAVKELLFPVFLGGAATASMSKWYVETYYPGMAAAGRGFSFSFLAEAYVNFGVPGVLGLFSLLGVLSRKADSAPRESWMFARGVFFAALEHVFFGDFNSILKAYVGLYVALPMILCVGARGVRAIVVGGGRQAGLEALRNQRS